MFSPMVGQVAGPMIGPGPIRVIRREPNVGVRLA